ncbi:MAG: ABC transporter substrate-binding protein [Desulfurococcales archaeon]|nr:ABC transporter substrate-binding protein [Desulfurococcales archaeon]
MGASRVVVAIIVLLVLAAGVYYGFSKRGGSMYTIRAATLQGGISTLDIIEREGLLESRGYGLKVMRLQKTPDIIAALVKNDTDLAVIPAEMAAKLVEEGHDIVIVGVDMLQNQAILVANNSNLTSPEDLQGKLVGAVLPSGTYKLFKAYMKVVYNLTVVEGEKPSPGVITAVNVPPGSILNSLERGDVDAVVIWEPFVSLGLARGDRILVSFQDLWKKAGVEGEPVMLVWVARADFAEKHPDALNAFLSARSEAASMWVANRSLVIGMLMDLYKLPADAANILYNRTVIVQGYLTEDLVKSIRSEWWLAWRGGYLEKDPASIPDSVFYMP